jgi:hypothetical protein
MQFYPSIYIMLLMVWNIVPVGSIPTNNYISNPKS